ncbi:hypothetical protein [Photobacterium sp. R1]
MRDLEYSQTVASYRSLIVKKWSFLSEMSPANAAYELTQYAIRKSIVKPRSPVKGELMTGWCKNNTAPLWACKSALCLCIESGWLPSNPIEWAVFSYLYIRTFPNLSFEKYIALLPAQFDETSETEMWLKKALNEQVSNRK